ncbi:MAG: HlyD family secretion protein [Xanthobacteraceae bacterium]
MLDQKSREPGEAPTVQNPPSVVAVEPAGSPIARVPVHHPNLGAGRRRLRAGVVILALAALGVGAGFYIWKHSQPVVPLGISWSNGRIEADEIDIDTKFAGRIAELHADIGDMVKAGQMVARMDTRDLQESLKKAEAQRRLAQRSIEEANANLEQLHAQQVFAAQELDRAQVLVKQGWTTKETFDQRKQTLDGANAAIVAGEAKVAEAEHALQAAEHDVGLYTVNINDNDLIAPRDGRIQYRIANIGEVLPAGGKVFTMLDVGYVYMDVYLPALEAGRIKIGAEARIVLDAYPDHPIPATVSFTASQSQFTPKTVETQNERDKLVFRIRVRIDEARSRDHADAVRSGLPGLAYIRWDPSVAWPARLQAAP